MEFIYTYMNTCWALSSSPWQLRSAILCFWADPLHSSHMQLWMNDCCYIYIHVFVVEYPLKWCTYSAVLVVTRLVTCETATVSACFVYTIQPCTSLQYHCTYNAVLVVTWLVDWHVKLLPSVHILCTPYNHAPVYSITLFEARFKIQDYYLIQEIKT